MNSWKSRRIWSVDAAVDDVEVRHRQPRRHSRRESATATTVITGFCRERRAAAIDTPTIALAPNRDLSGVPSSARRASDRPPAANRTSRLVSASAIGPLTLATACQHTAAPVAIVVVAQFHSLAAARRRPGRHPDRTCRPSDQRGSHTTMSADRANPGSPSPISTKTAPPLHILRIPCPASA